MFLGFRATASVTSGFLGHYMWTQVLRFREVSATLERTKSVQFVRLFAYCTDLCVDLHGRGEQQKSNHGTSPRIQNSDPFHSKHGFDLPSNYYDDISRIRRVEDQTALLHTKDPQRRVAQTLPCSMHYESTPLILRFYLLVI